jgi:TPR repeat protein
MRKSHFTLLLPIVLLGLGGCASTPPPKTEVTTPRTCETAGSGLAVAPAPETRTAIRESELAKDLSLDQLFEQVAAGNSVAQIELGIRYASGRALQVDVNRAVSLFAASSAQDNPLGTFLLGTAYINGQGVELDVTRAAELWERAARQGHPLSQHWLGILIAQGRGGITPNWCAAAPLFVAAANEGETDAAYMLGYGHQTGELSDFNYQKAAEWYRKSMAKGLNQKAQFNMRVMIEKNQIEWQPGDPGVAPTPGSTDGVESPPSTIIDESASKKG